MAVIARRGRNIPILSKGAGCVAAWQAGGLYGPSLSGTSIRDFVSNSHHAAMPGGSNDPLHYAADSQWYVYFPGTSGNSATITLSNSTVYDYTITYSDGTTDTDTQTSTGAGLLTFGGTDVKFAGLKVRRIVITADGGGATIADIDFSRRALWNAALTSLTAVTGGQTVTINRTTTGRQVWVVNRPALNFAADDYLDTPDNDVFNPGLRSFSVAVAFRKYSGPLATIAALLTKKSTNVAGSAGWALDYTSTSYVFRVSDGTSIVAPTAALADLDGRDVVLIGTVDRGRVTARISALVDGKAHLSSDTSISSVGSVTNSVVVRHARYAGSASSFRQYEGLIFASAYFGRAVLPSEEIEVARALNGGI